MQPKITNEELMKFLDDELGPEDRTRVERELSVSTELQRDLARFRQMRAEVRSLGADVSTPGLWGAVHSRLTRPLGWTLLIAGSALWSVWALWLYFTSQEDLILKLGTGAVLIGVALLLGVAVQERWVEWQTDPYRDIDK